MDVVVVVVGVVGVDGCFILLESAGVAGGQRFRRDAVGVAGVHRRRRRQPQRRHRRRRFTFVSAVRLPSSKTQ